MKHITATYLVVGPLAYQIVSDYPLAFDKSYLHFFQHHSPTREQGVRVMVDCEVKVVEEAIHLVGNNVYCDSSRSIYVTSDGMETRAFRFSDKSYAVCQEISSRHLVLSLPKQCLVSGYVAVNIFFLEALMMERYMMECEGLILHSSFISHHDKSILFTAPSGTGKSTQATLWEKYAGAEVINGDRSVVWYDDIEGRFMTSGLPFCGSSCINKVRTIPLRGIVFISQSPENHAEIMSASVAVRKIFGEVSVNKWNADFVERALDLINHIVKSVTLVRLECNMEEEAVNTLKALVESQELP